MSIETSKVTLEFTVAEVDSILGLLAKLPYAEVTEVIAAIITQGRAQVAALEAAEAASQPTATDENGAEVVVEA